MIKLAHILLLEDEQPKALELDPSEALAQHLEALEDALEALRFAMDDADRLNLPNKIAREVEAVRNRVNTLSYKCDYMRKGLLTLDSLLYELPRLTYDEFGPQPRKTLEELFRWLRVARLQHLPTDASNLVLAVAGVKDTIRDERFSRGYGIARRLVQLAQNVNHSADGVGSALDSFNEFLTPLD